MSNETLTAGEVVPRPLSDAEREMARAAQRCIVAALDHSRAASITVIGEGERDGGPVTVGVPPQALRLIAQILGAMSERRPVVIMPARQELSTVEAANYLNVSRPFLIRELEAGRLAYRMVGTHRRVAFEDLREYEAKMRASQQAALDRLAADRDELGLEY